jgi:hypothetical protein
MQHSCRKKTEVFSPQVFTLIAVLCTYRQTEAALYHLTLCGQNISIREMYQSYGLSPKGKRFTAPV